jgi:hypothetical protein
MIFDYRDQYSGAQESETENRAGPLWRITLIFAATGLGAAILAAPMMRGVAESYSEGGPYGIDRILTGGTQKTARYTVRKSVLNPYAEKICGVQNQRLCEN